MVFFLVAIAAPRLSRRSIALISAAIAVAAELFRLIHTPALDAFRLTLAGALLLGRIFSPWDMLAYGIGIILAMGLDRLAQSFSRPTPPCWGALRRRHTSASTPHAQPASEDRPLWSRSRP